MTLEEAQPFRLSFIPDEDDVVVAVEGEVDVLTADELRARLLEACTTWPGAVTVDYARVSFLDFPGHPCAHRRPQGV